MSRKPKCVIEVLILFVVGAAVAQENPPKGGRPSKVRAANAAANTVTTALGRQNFEFSCSGCHGLDGRGGEHAPNIARNPAVQQLSDGRLMQIIRNGFPQGGMPAFDMLGDRQIAGIVRYLRLLANSSQGWRRGDAAVGQKLFFGKAECSQCHMFEGKGGFIGADLSAYAKTHAPEEIREAIVDPARNASPEQLPVKVVTKDGTQVFGMVRSQDNFSVAVQDLEGGFHLLSKSDIASLERSTTPVMPTNYVQRLSSAEIDDLVRFLAGTGVPNASSRPGAETNR